ncbi:unnamed product [Ostreococcus tauri]|uniref:Unnamed product n=2 Tax=Ostreococcus tauri TaxID=70448 RepID=A0A090M4T4_OSTTA|nr:unnamed product [Ostreococcus tauri]CEF97687.1 unnamed product [Ostreococcus tauri]|eukprot:XP_003078943.2 unnamed product [Ostreococcus tauri]
MGAGSIARAIARAVDAGETTTGRRGAGARARARAMRAREGVVSALAACVLTTTHVAPARAFSGEIALDRVTYEEVTCPVNQYVPNARTKCVMFTARAKNETKGGRMIESANVFGFIEDADRESAATVNPDGSSRTVLSAIDAPIPRGESEVKFVVTVFPEALAKGPLTLKGFKAVGSVADIDKRFKPFDACEVDPDSCL